MSVSERRLEKKKLVRQFLTLGLPVVLIQGGMMSMVLVDTWFVARLGPLAVAAVGLGSTLAVSLHLFCAGTLTALEYFSSRALGQKNSAASWDWFLQANYLAIFLGIGAFVGTMGIALALPWFGIAPDMVVLTQSFLFPLGVSFLPMFLFFTARQYLASHQRLRVSTVAIIAGNLTNYLFNMALIEGRFGFPALGVTGSGMATLITRAVMAALLMGHAWRISSHRRWVRPRREPLIALSRLGFPAGGQMLARALAFSVVGILVARLGPVAMAAHTITLNLGGFFYMIPMGMGTAGCLLVAHAVGQQNEPLAGRIGDTAIQVTTALMALVAVALFSQRERLMQAFTTDASVIRLGAAIMVLVAALQLFDGFQTAVIGALRGMGDSKAALSSNLAGLWIVGLPTALLFGFVFRQGLLGLWMGLIVGLFVSSLLLLLRWRKQTWQT